MDLTALYGTWSMFQRKHSCSVDRMLCDPELRAAFFPPLVPTVADENTILWGLVTLRKEKCLPRNSR